MLNEQNNKLRKFIMVTSIVIFILSLPVKYECTQFTCDKGWGALVFGWMGILTGDFKYVVWYANPLLFLSWLFSQEKRTSLLLSLIAFLLAIMFMGFDTILGIDGEVYYIRSLGIGYWLWLSAIAVMLIYNGVLWYKGRNSSSRDNEH
jgi:hypothetical protein